jgi:cholesterol transport system auxiliary component
MRWLRRLAALAALLPAGCALLPAPPPEPARAVLNQAPEQIPHRRSSGLILVVSPLEASPAYDTTRMAYSTRPFEIGYFRDHEWAEPPARMIGSLLVRTLRETGFFRAVPTTPAVRPAWRLEADLLQLLQDHTVTPPVLRLRLHVRLSDASGQLAGERDMHVEQPMAQPTPYAGIVAANAAAAAAVQEAVRFVLAAFG